MNLFEFDRPQTGPPSGIQETVRSCSHENALGIVKLVTVVTVDIGCAAVDEAVGATTVL